MNAHWAGLPLGAKTHVMGIVNATPDSFSGDGLAGADDPAAAAADQAAAMAKAGAALIDVGGESTRPGSTPITTADEIARVAPAIRAIRAALPETLISIDTMKAEVAAAALDAGANIVNDVTAFDFDADMAALCAARGAPIAIMHNAARADRLDGDSFAADDASPGFINRLSAAMAAMRDRARSAGIADDAILLDPGIGFGKTVGQNLAILRELPRLRATLDAPLLVGASRKSFIGRIIGGAPQDRGPGDAAVSALAASGGADVLRVHDVETSARAAAIGRAVGAAAA